MSDAIDLLLLKLDDLKTQHSAGINPGRDEIVELFDLHEAAKRERASQDPVDTTPPASTPAPVRELVTDIDVAVRRPRGATRRKKVA